MPVVVKIRGRDNYWKYTLYSWMIEIKDILEKELGERVVVGLENGDSEDPEILINDVYVGSGVPGEEGYLIEIIKKAYYMIKESR